MNNRTRSKILSLVMAAAMLFTLIPGVTVYAVDSGDPPLGASGVITAFDPLPVDVAAQDVATGTALADLNLPDTLDAEIGGEQGSVSDVTWQPEPDYNGDTEGTYTFTADIPATYTVNAEPPVITVTLLLFAKLGMARAAGITPATPGGISKAVTNAGDGGVIILTPGTYNIDSTITINKNLTIRGAGADTIIVAGGLGGIFAISSGCTVTIENITLTGGKGSGTEGGGAIYNAGTLELIDCTFTGNEVGNRNGGAICNYSGELTLTGCTFTGNEAGGNGSSGAIYNSGGELTLTGCTFTGNKAGSSGGAIFNSGGELTLEDCTFTGNNATKNGGAICDYGTLTLTGCTFTGNNATDGGAVYVTGDYATVVTGSLFTGNSSGLYIAADARNTKINYNRIFNNTGYDLVDSGYLGGDDSDSEYNWWGENKPKDRSKVFGTLTNYFLMEAAAPASTSVGNGGTVTLDYVFQVNVRRSDNSLLPYFAAEVFGSWDTSGNPIASFDARYDKSFEVTLPTNFIGLVTVTVTVDNETQNFPIDITENVPGVPQSFAATPGDGQVTLTWAAPLSDGGSPITHYEVSSDNGITWNTASTDIGHTFTGLTNGTQYTFKVRAVNALGGGAEASATVAPADTAKTVIVGAQNGTLTEGTAGSVAFAVSTANIPSGSAITLNNSVAGITLNTAATTGDSTTVTISTTAATPAGNHPLTLTIDGVTSNNFTLGVSGGGSFSGGSGGSDSSGGRQDSVRAITAPQPVTMAQAKAAYAAALQAAKESGSDTVSLTLRGDYSEIPLDILQALTGWARRDGMAIRLTVDVTKDSSVTARYVLDPSVADRSVSLLASAGNPSEINTAARFKRWFKNKLTAIATGQEDGFGMPVDIAVKVDLAGMDAENLYFYSYDSKTNQYRRIEKPAYWIDKNGYLRFTTELAGDIIISEGLLERK